MLDKLPPELLRLVGEVACPRSEIVNDVVIHGAALTHPDIATCRWSGRRRTWGLLYKPWQMRCSPISPRPAPSPRLKLRDVVGPDGCVAQSGTNTRIPTRFSAAGPPRGWSSDTKYVEGQGEVIEVISQPGEIRHGRGGRAHVVPGASPN